MTETISGIEVNFANGGGAHSASVTAIEGAGSATAAAALGGIRGAAGQKPVFTDSELNDLLENFILTEKTVSKDSVKTTISRKYSDKTSLVLQANILLVRGINASPNNDLDFDGIVPFWGEVSNAPPNYKFPVLGPIKTGGVVVVGKIYNISTEDASVVRDGGHGYDIHQASLVYNNGLLIEGMSQNSDVIRSEVKASPDLTGFSLKFGYSLSDFKIAVGLIGVNMEGLPALPDVLFEYSGTFESVISSIASDIGYYWFVHPKTGVVTMVNSKIAADYEIDDPTEDTDENILASSYTESALTPVIVNTYAGSTQKDSGSQGAKDVKKRVRATTFNRLYFPSDVGDLTFKACASFLGLYLSGEFNYSNFQKMAWTVLTIYKGDAEPFFGKSYPYSLQNQVSPPTGWDKIKTHKAGTKDNAGGNPDISPEIGNRGAATYVQLKFEGDISLPEPALIKLFEDLKLYYENFGGIGISNGFSNYKADRMSFINSSGVSIVGPFDAEKNIKQIPELTSFDNQLTKLGLGGKTIHNIAVRAKVSNRPSLPNHYLSFRNVKEFAKLALEGEIDGGGELDYDFLAGKMELLEKGGLGSYYIGGKGNWAGKVKEKLESSIKLYGEIVETGGSDRVSYTVGKSVTNKDKIPDDENDNSEETTEADEKLQQLTENIDLKNYSIVTNGADGTELRPVTLNAASGSSLDMTALKSINPDQEPSETPLVSSSKTIYGLEIPDFKPTISSLSISVGSDGVTTTVGESSLKLIPMDMDIMKDKYFKTSIPKGGLGRLGAGARNFMGL